MGGQGSQSAAGKVILHTGRLGGLLCCMLAGRGGGVGGLAVILGGMLAVTRGWGLVCIRVGVVGGHVGHLSFGPMVLVLVTWATLVI